MILDFWRTINSPCPVCKKAICSCSVGCKCSYNVLEEYYNKLWIVRDTPSTESKTMPWYNHKKTLRDVWAESKDMAHRWPIIRSFIHKIPYIVWNIFSKIEILNLINWMLYLLCDDCREHAKDFINKNQNTIVDNDNKSLIVFINDFHNHANSFWNNKTYLVEQSLYMSSVDLVKNKILDQQFLVNNKGGINV